MKHEMKELDERVHKFKQLSLPGQPKILHVGTSNLISDLYAAVTERDAEILRLRRALEECGEAGDG